MSDDYGARLMISKVPLPFVFWIGLCMIPVGILIMVFAFEIAHLGFLNFTWDALDDTMFWAPIGFMFSCLGVLVTLAGCIIHTIRTEHTATRYGVAYPYSNMRHLTG